MANKSATHNNSCSSTQKKAQTHYDSRIQVHMWLLIKTSGKLNRGAIQETEKIYNVTTRRISTIWSTTKRQKEAGQISNMARVITHKEKEFKYNLMQ